MHDQGAGIRAQGVGQDREHEHAPAELTAIARAAIAAHLAHRSYESKSLPPPWQSARGVFVTLRDPQGELRGCIGHITPVLGTLAEEVASCAVSAAIHDPRFAPLAPEELESLRIEVSVLGPTEPVQDRHALNAQRYGVVVHAGRRRGVLLPAIEGVNSVAEQLSIVLRKAGIDASEPYQVERFEVLKVAESRASAR